MLNKQQQNSFRVFEDNFSQQGITLQAEMVNINPNASFNKNVDIFKGATLVGTCDTHHKRISFWILHFAEALHRR